ncbi:glutamate receptor ionotropic, delta-1-like, partial [Galendromus occidentalis]|uniref:Glutamate receptor ionotropic, delta-1-like n=1 Tax=Galendromus occidentalis TaxID=34638 RepID=A0AAJ6QQ43_9ACAR
MSEHIRVVFNLFPPWVYPAALPDGRIELEGMFGSLVDNLTYSLNLTYEASIPSDGLYGHKFENNTWSGMLGALDREEADLAVGPFTLDHDLFMDFDTMPSCEYTFITALTGMKKAFETKPTPYTKAFQPITWVCIAASISLLSILITGERWILGGEVTFWSATSDIFTMMQTLLQESTKDRFNYLFARINGGIWIIGSFLLMQFFTQDLKANMVVKAPTMRISSLDQIVEKKWLQIAYPIQSPIGSILETTPGEFGD